MSKVLDSFCRTCMVKVVGQTNQIIPSFDIFQTEGLAHKFAQCTKLQVHPDDEYPSSVCEKCLASVLSLYHFQIMCRESIDKFSSMLVENKPKPEISCHLDNNNSAVTSRAMANQVVLKCQQYDLPELAVVVIPLSALTNSQLAEMDGVKTGITDLQATHENQQTDDGTTKEIMAKQAKPHEKGSQDEIHCNEDDVKLENSSDEEGINTDSDCASPDSKEKQTSLGLPFQCATCSKKFRIQPRFEAHMRRHLEQLAEIELQVQEPSSINNRKSKPSKHLNSSSTAGITDLQPTNENQQADEEPTTKIRAKKGKSHDKSSQDEVHCNEDEDKLQNSSDEEGKLQIQEPTSSNNRKSERAKHLNRSSKAGITDLQATNENQQTDEETTTKIMAKKAKSHEKGTQDEIHCNEDEDKLQSSSDEEGKLQIRELPSSNNRKSKRAKHLNRSSTAAITDLKATNDNQQTEEETTTKIMAKKAKSHDKSSQDEVHCNEDEDKLQNSSDEEGKLQIQEPTSSNNRKSERAKHLNRSSKAGITDLQATNENQQTDEETTTKIMAKKAKSHEKGTQDEIHCNEDEDKLQSSSDEEGKLQIRELPSSNNRKSKRAKHLNRSSTAAITDLKATNDNQQTEEETTTKIMAKKAKSHDKSSQDEVHCNEDEDKLQNSSDEEGKLQIQEPTSSNNRKSERAKHLNRSSKAGITALQATNENQQTDEETTTKIMAKKAKSHDKSSQDEVHCNEDEDKLQSSSDEEGKLQIRELPSSNNRKSKRAKHLNRSSTAAITDLQPTNENQQTDEETTTKIMAKKAKSHEKDTQDEIHCNEDEDKLQSSSDEEGKLQIRELPSSNNRKSKRAKHLNRSSTAAITDLKATNDNQQTEEETTTKIMAKKAKSHDKSSQDEVHCNEDEDKLQSSSDEEGKLQIRELPSSNNRKSKRAKHLNRSSTEAITDLQPTNENQEADEEPPTKIRAKKAKSHDKSSQDEVHCNEDEDKLQNSSDEEGKLQIQEPTSSNNRKSERAKHLNRSSKAGITDLQATNENQQTDEETTTKIMAKKAKSHEKGTQDEIHCNEDEDKLQSSSDEEGKLQIRELPSSNNGKSKRAKHLNRSSTAAITDLKATNDNQQTAEGTTTKIMAKEAKSHDKSSQDEVHCNEDEDKLGNSSEKQGKLQIQERASSNNRKSKRVKHLARSSKAGITDLQATNENQQTDKETTTKSMETKAKSHEKSSLDEIHCNEDEDKLENSSEEDRKLQIQEPTSSNNRKSKRSKHLNSSSTAGITDLQPTNENQQADEEPPTKIMAKKAKSHDKRSQDEIHCNEDEDKLGNSSEEQGKLQTQDSTSSNNRKSKRAKHISRSSKAGITNLQATNENQQTNDGTTKKIMTKKAKSHDKSSQGEIHCNENGDNLENSSDEEGFNTDSDCASPDSKAKTSMGHPFQCDTCSKKFRIQHCFEAHVRRHQGQLGEIELQVQEPTSSNRRQSKRFKHLNRSSKAGITNLRATNENQQTDEETTTIIMAKKAKSHEKGSQDEIHCNEDSDMCEWPFVCDFKGCSKRFRILFRLKIHQKRHAGIKNYACPNLRTHIKNKHGHRAGVHPDNEIKQKRRFQCRFCDKAFLRVGAKKYHEMTHTGEKPLVCDECGKKFRQPAALKVHLRTHIKNAPRGYVCRICGRAYFTSQNLKYHEMKHRGHKYKCDQCDLKYVWPSGLMGHQKLHHRDKQVKETTESDKQANSNDISKDE